MAGSLQVAQKNMEQILTKMGNKVDAVVASNDGTAGGAVAALSAKGIRGMPVSGQDADHAALNRIALGTQTVSVWKDSRELGKEAASAAVALADGKHAEEAGRVERRREEGRDLLALPHAGADHARQPRRRRQGRLDQEGRSLQGRDARHRQGLRLNVLARFLKAAELDTRLLGMVGALLLIWIAFHVLSGGVFLTPRNLWNFSVQSASVAIMATGMVLVIVTRNIDLSIGSMLGFIGMVMGVMQVELLPKFLGFEHPATWILTLAAGLVLGVVLGGFQGFLIAYLGIPSFIVTLGGLLVWRGAAWWVTGGQTVAPLDATFKLMGGGPEGAIGAAWSWAVGLVACAAVAALLAQQPRPAQEISLSAAADGGRSLCSAAWPARSSSARWPWPMLIPGRSAACAVTRKQTISRCPMAGCSSRTASRFRS